MLLVLSSLVWALPADASHSMRTVSTTRVGEEGGLGRVEVHKDLAAVLQRDEGVIAMVHVGDPRRPKVLGRYDDGATQSLDGDVAFSSDGRFVIYARQTVQFSRDGIHVIDVSDPKNPVLRSYSPGGGAYRVLFHSDASGDFVVLLDAVLGLVVYRFLEGVLIPVHVDAFPALKVGGPASAGMVIANGLLYVTTMDTGLQVYDFSDPAAPALMGSWNEEGLAEVEVAKAGKKVTAYAATEYWSDAQNANEIVVLDVSDPQAIRETDRWSYRAKPDAETRLQGMTSAGGILYAAHSAEGVVGFRDGRVVERFGPGIDCFHMRPGQACIDVLTGAAVTDIERLGPRFLVTDESGFLLVLAR